ncbi:MAG TPA: DUF930 domain-containing protein [Beijerinckiaceae bacterium]|nr:DUF930 domain-containing protein [Beijerinckiaceae bacterium]
MAAKPSAQQEKRLDQQMLKLDLGTRIEQRCDARAGGDVSREHKGFRVEQVIAYAFSDPEIRGTEVTARGAIVRSRGKWYRLSYRCRTTPDGTGIELFEHSLGPEVPGWSIDKIAP